MGSNTLHKKCPRCKRKRTFTVPEHCFSSGREWDKRDGVWVCYWCIARETPDGEAKLRVKLKNLIKARKERNKKQMAKTESWIKFHLLSVLSPENTARRRELWATDVERVQFLFPREKEIVDKIAKHLVETGQVILEDGYGKLGNVIFEDGKEVSAKANSAANKIYENLCDRRGIKNALWSMDPDVKEELLNTMAAIIDEEMK